MKIALIDMDNAGKKKIAFPNVPLMKLAAYHKARGDSVEWWFPLNSYDIAYKSRIFDFTPEMLGAINADEVIGGGTGYGIRNKLPPAVERCAPDYSIYPQFAQIAYGFLTRGCPRGCPWCIVPDKEGESSERVADLSDFRAGRHFLKLLDPNLLACRDHEALLQQLIAARVRVDFTQGLDIRLTTADNIALLKRANVARYHFAWDNPDDDLTGYFERFKALSGIKDYRLLGVYVLTNYNTTHAEDLYRVNTLRRIGFDPYVMIYNKPKAPEVTRHLQRWVNNKMIFRATRDFSEYDASRG